MYSICSREIIKKKKSFRESGKESSCVFVVLQYFVKI